MSSNPSTPEPVNLTVVRARPPADVAHLAVAVQANLVQLKVSESRRASIATAAHEIRASAPGAVTRFREVLIPRQAIATYDDLSLQLRLHEVWGQFCLFCWYFCADDPQSPPDFRNLPRTQALRCPATLLAKTNDIEKSLWRLRFEQSFRAAGGAAMDPQLERDYQAAMKIPAQVMGESVQVCSDQNLLLGSCEFAGMLAAARWCGDLRWRWGQDGIMDLPGRSPI